MSTTRPSKNNAYATDEQPGRSIEDLVDAARHRAAEDGSGPEAGIGAGIWSPSASATESMLGVADHSETLDEPGKFGRVRVAAAGSTTIVERGAAKVRASIADVYGTVLRTITLRREVGSNWHRRIAAEHALLLATLLAVAVGAEVVFASTAAQAVGLYAGWKQVLFGGGAAIAYLGVGDFIGRTILGDTQVRTPDPRDPDADDGGSARPPRPQTVDHDPVIAGRRGPTPTGKKLLAVAALIWLLGTTGLTILREANAEQVAAVQQADRNRARAALVAAGEDPDTATLETGGTHGLRDGIAMWSIAALIGGGIALIAATRSDPVVKEWHSTTGDLTRAVRLLDTQTTRLIDEDVARQEDTEALRDHHDALAHRTAGHAFLASAQELAYRHGTWSPAQDDQSAPSSGLALPPSTAGHHGEIEHQLDRARRVDELVSAVEHHAALATALAASAQGIEPQPDLAESEADMLTSLRSWLLTPPVTQVVDLRTSTAPMPGPRLTTLPAVGADPAERPSRNGARPAGLVPGAPGTDETR